MSISNISKGFSKLSTEQKIELLNLSVQQKELIAKSGIELFEYQNIINELSENTIANFSFPFGIAPNVLINNHKYFVPLVTEESSVVAAIAKAAKFWFNNGGFKAEILGTTKKGQVHFFWKGTYASLNSMFIELKQYFLQNTHDLTQRMQARGGGIKNIELQNNTDVLKNYYCIDIDFETSNAMGANFINSCLERIADLFKEFIIEKTELSVNLLEINMAILSNYTPNSKVKVKASCSKENINNWGNNLGVSNFADRFITAVNIAQNNISRAVTHNKGIFNGIDAVLLATANDWRAVEAGAHAYASRSGKYQSLSNAYIKDSNFVFELELPLAVGTVGGVTSLHPMAKLALDILEKPNAEQLMKIVASTGLAANFSAISALVSSGIQKGHMKMHESNLKRLNKQI